MIDFAKVTLVLLTKAFVPLININYRRALLYTELYFYILPTLPDCLYLIAFT